MRGVSPPAPVARAYRFVNRPYYLYRPVRLLRRARRRPTPAPREQPRLLETAWGSRLYCFGDSVGDAVERTGTYELVVAEALARLAHAGETAVDAGANVGLFSNLLANLLGDAGRVLAFEPHPDIHQLLVRNIGYWHSAEALGNVDARPQALSSGSGAGELTVWEDFAANRGTASLEPMQRGAARTVQVPTVRLDDVVGGRVGVLKIDVEEHELPALHGAERLLAEGRIRDVVFESHREPPTEVTDYLGAHGYTVLAVRQALSGPLLCAPHDGAWRRTWDPPTLLATCEPARARERFRPRGWRSLRRGLRSQSGVSQ